MAETTPRAEPAVPVEDEEIEEEVEELPEHLSQVGFAEEPYEDEDLEDRLFPSKIGGRPVCLIGKSMAIDCSPKHFYAFWLALPDRVAPWQDLI